VPKWTIVGVGVTAVLALTACNPATTTAAPPSTSASPSTPSAPAPSPTIDLPADPRQAVLDAAGRLGSEPFKLKFSSLGQQATGSIDLKGKTSEIATKLDSGATITVRQFDTDQYVQVTGDATDALHAVPGKWMQIDTKGLPAGNPLSASRNQAASGANLLKSAKSVKLGGPRIYSGTVDLSRGGAAALPSSVTSKLKAVPFTATLDPWGRFTSLVFDLNSAVTGAGQLNSSYFDYGTPVTLTRPEAAETVPMPDAFKKSIGL
jgi:hypothetical protein